MSGRGIFMGVSCHPIHEWDGMRATPFTRMPMNPPAERPKANMSRRLPRPGGCVGAPNGVSMQTVAITLDWYCHL